MPWVDGGSPIPEPQEELLGPELQEGQEPTPSYAILMWSKTLTQDRHFHVSLWTTWQHGQVESDEPVDVEINGSPGYMHAHEGSSPNTAVIIWDIGTDKCSVIHLVLRTPPLPLREVKSELLKIATSLENT